MLDVRLFETAAGRRPVQGFLDDLPERYRALYRVEGGVMRLLHGCKKQDQDAGIEVARERMKQVR